MDTLVTTPPAPSDPELPKKYIRTFEGDIETLKKGGAPDLVPLEKPTPLKTYSDDFSQRIKETQASTASILAAEQDAAAAPEPAPQKISHSRWNIFYVIAGVALLLLGGWGFYVAYTGYLEKKQPAVLTSTVSAPIFVDEKEEISDATPAMVREAIVQSVSRSLAPNTVRLLYFADATTTGHSVFSSLEPPAPSALLRNINAALSMAGVVNTGGSQSPFFILSVASYGDTFAGMLVWEKTMARDMSPLFPPFAEPTATSTASTTASTSSPQAATATTTPPTPVFTPVFRDEIIDNHDVRVYRDSRGRSVLLYGYWNQTTLIVARNPLAFTEILARLSTFRASQE